MAKKIFVLDTNVLLHDPGCLERFEDNKIVIPLVCIEEIDKFKKDLTETGRNAREVSRVLDRLRDRYKGELSHGVPINGGGTLVVALDDDEGLEDWPYKTGKDMTNDDRILAVAWRYRDNPDNLPVFMLSRDTNVRIKADALGLQADDYRNDRVDIDELYTGMTEVDVSRETVDNLYRTREIPMPEGMTGNPNQFFLLHDESDPQHSGFARIDADIPDALVPGGYTGGPLWGILPRNVEQKAALDLLTDDRIRLVTLVGKAGTGKTLLALAAGLSMCMDEQRYKRLLVSRPVIPMGRDIGFLPGELKDKLRPWMQPIFDNLEFLIGGPEKDQSEYSGKKHQPIKEQRGSYQYLMDRGLLEVEPLTYIRGRSIPGQYFIVDEAQNLTPHEMKTILTRAGQDTKIVLTGDPYQIDNPYLDTMSNGLTYVVERLKGQAIFGHITLRKGERSRLAQTAADLL